MIVLKIPRKGMFTKENFDLISNDQNQLVFTNAPRSTFFFSIRDKTKHQKKPETMAFSNYQQ